MDATWDDAGVITATHTVLALPAISYEPNPADWVVSRMAPDIVLLVLVAFYSAMTFTDLHFTFHIQVRPTPAPSCPDPS